MVSSKNIGNAASTFGRFAALFQGVMCVSVAITLLVAGAGTLGSAKNRGRETVARVRGVECDARGNVCAIAVRLPCGSNKTFETSNAFKFSVGDDITVFVDDKGNVSEKLPYAAMGTAMIATGVCAGVLAIWALTVISRSRDLSQVFGGLTIFSFLFN